MDSAGRRPTHSTTAGGPRFAAPPPPARLGNTFSAPDMDCVPPPLPPLDPRGARGERRWVEWQRQIGRRLRALRELTGLSQDRLARIAGTNQAALSRLEGGKGLVPVSLLAHLGPALAANIIDRTLLSPEGERLLSALETIGPSGLEQWLPVAHDPGLHDLIHWYQRASAVQRKMLLAVARAVSFPGAAS